MSSSLIAQRQKAIRKHLFLICPNNSGSTYLSKAIAKSRSAWSLPAEGQHVVGYAGPSTLESKWPLIWGASEESVAHFRDWPDYDWERSRKAWYFHASAARDDAPVFLTKSPPFLLIADQLAANFPNPNFLFMVRNPYAAMEGVLRRPRRAGDAGKGKELPRIAAQHFVACLKAQKKNIETYRECSIAFTYEELCARPGAIASRIAALVPELDDLDLTQKLSIKQTYNEPLRNMNEEQIARLTGDQIAMANEVFWPNAELLSHFDYQVIDK